MSVNCEALPMESVKTDTYYILQVMGKYQEWDRVNPKKLTKSVDFVGYVGDVAWSFAIYDDLSSAHRFKAPFPIYDYKNFGPWWYQPADHRWIRCVEQNTITRSIVP